MSYAGIENLGSCSPDNLIAGPAERVMGLATIAASQNLGRGTVLGRITASGQAVPVDKSKEDGAQNLYAILADDVVTGEETEQAEVYLSGEFAISALALADGSTASDFEEQGRKLGIYFRKTVEV